MQGQGAFWALGICIGVGFLGLIAWQTRQSVQAVDLPRVSGASQQGGWAVIGAFDGSKGMPVAPSGPIPSLLHSFGVSNDPPAIPDYHGIQLQPPADVDPAKDEDMQKYTFVWRTPLRYTLPVFPESAKSVEGNPLKFINCGLPQLPSTLPYLDLVVSRGPTVVAQWRISNLPKPEIHKLDAPTGIVTPLPGLRLQAQAFYTDEANWSNTDDAHYFYDPIETTVDLDYSPVKASGSRIWTFGRCDFQYEWGDKDSAAHSPETLDYEHPSAWYDPQNFVSPATHHAIALQHSHALYFHGLTQSMQATGTLRLCDRQDEVFVFHHVPYQCFQTPKALLPAESRHKVAEGVRARNRNGVTATLYPVNESPAAYSSPSSDGDPDPMNVCAYRLHISSKPTQGISITTEVASQNVTTEFIRDGASGDFYGDFFPQKEDRKKYYVDMKVTLHHDTVLKTVPFKIAFPIQSTLH